MHELTLMDDLVSMISGELSDQRVHVVRLEVGLTAAIDPRALQFCFEVCTRGTLLEGAMLEILEACGDTLRLRELEVSDVR